MTKGIDWDLVKGGLTGFANASAARETERNNINRARLINSMSTLNGRRVSEPYQKHQDVWGLIGGAAKGVEITKILRDAKSKKLAEQTKKLKERNDATTKLINSKSALQKLHTRRPTRPSRFKQITDRATQAQPLPQSQPKAQPGQKTDVFGTDIPIYMDTLGKGISKINYSPIRNMIDTVPYDITHGEDPVSGAVNQLYYTPTIDAQLKSMANPINPYLNRGVSSRGKKQFNYDRSMDIQKI